MPRVRFNSADLVRMVDASLHLETTNIPLTFLLARMEPFFVPGSRRFARRTLPQAVRLVPKIVACYTMVAWPKALESCHDQAFSRRDIQSQAF